MIRSVFFFFFLWLSLILSMVLFIPFPLFLIPVFKKLKNKYVGFWTRHWAGFSLFLSGSKIHVNGRENIPDQGSFVIIANHQGFMDIPVLMKIFPYPLSFVTKKELLKVPLINLWILALNCLVIDRRRPYEAYKRISSRMADRSGNPVIIFPEGTRSRGEKAGQWKKGGLKIIHESGITEIMVKISGSYKIWEEKGRIVPALIDIEILQPHYK